MKKLRKRSSAIVAFVLIFALVISMIPRNEVSANTTEGDYTVISLKDKTGAAYEAGYVTSTISYDLGSDKTLENTSFQGKFKFSSTGNAMYIGYTGAGGLLIQPQTDGTLGLRWRSRAHENTAQAFKYITTTEGKVNSFVGEWFELRVSFTFSDKTADRTNVTAMVQINDATPIEYKTTSTVPTGMLTRAVVLQGVTDAPLYHDLIPEKPVEMQVITLADGAGYVAGKVTDRAECDLGVDKTLKNTIFQGKFKFSSASNAMYIGYKGGGGLLIQPQSDGTLGLRWRSSVHENTAQSWKYITTTEGKVNSFVGEWFELRVAFTFSDTTAEKTNATAMVQINDATPIEYKTTSPVPLGMLTRGVYLQGTGEAEPLYHDLIQEETAEKQVISLADYANYAAGSYTGTPLKFNIGSDGESLDQTIFTQSFRITSTNHVMYIGIQGRQGLKLQMTEEGNLSFTWCSSNGNSATKTILAASCGRNTFINQWFDLYIAFDFTETTDTTAMVAATIQVDNYEAITYTSEKALLLTELVRAVRIENASTDYPIYHRPVVDFKGYEPISFDDCAGYTPGSLNTSKNYNLGNDKSLNNTVFAGEFMFTGGTEADSTIRLGGNGMYGLHLYLSDENTLQVNYRTKDTTNFHNIKIVLGTINASDVGITSFLNDWLDLKVGVSFINPGDTYTGLKVSVKINGYAQTFETANNNNSDNTPMIGALMRYVCLQGGADNPLHHRVREAYEAEIITMLDKTGAAYEAGKVTSDSDGKFDLGASEGLNLDNTRFVGRIKFTSLENSNNALFVGMLGGGVRIIPQASDSLQIYWRARIGDGSTYNQNVNLGTISAQDAGVTSFKEQWIDLSLEFHFINKSTETTDLNITIAMGDTFKQTYSVTGAVLAGATRYVHLVCNNAEYPIYHESPIPMEYYNLNDTDAGYLLSGRGQITVNHQEYTAGDTLAHSGDYIIRSTLYDAYVKHVILYRPGDAHVDDDLDVRDLVAVLKAGEGTTLSTKSAQKGADANKDSQVNDDDAVKVRQFLLGIDAQVIKTLSYQEGVMPVAGYYGPYRTTDAWGESYDLIRDDIYKKIADMGINLINYTSADYKVEAQRKDVIDNLYLAQKYGIGMYVLDSRITSETSPAQLVNYIGEYSKYSSYKGNFLIDEPYTEGYSKNTSILEDTDWEKGIKRLEDHVASAQKLNSYANTIGYINLHPLADRLKVNFLQSLETAYKNYIDSYFTTDARVLSWDHYVWDQKLSGSSDTSTGSSDATKEYFQNMSIAKEKADAANIPFWTYIQAGSNWNGSQTSGIAPTTTSFPSKAELFWNINTSLAYGAKGIQYFTLVQPAYFAFTEDEAGNKTYDYRRNGLIGADGTTNAWYDYAKEANQQIAIVDEYLMNAKSLAVISSGRNNAQKATGTTDTYGTFKISTDSTERGALAGVFDYAGKTAFYVVNYDTSGDSSNQVTIDFGSNKKYKIISGEQLVGSESVEQVGTSCTLNLVDGGAALIVLQ